MQNLATEITMGVAGRLREERQRLGYSQAQFAERLGLAKNTQLQYEAGRRAFDYCYLLGAVELGLDAMHVLFGPAPSQPPKLNRDPLAVKYRLMAKGITQADIAHSLRVSRQAVNAVITGEKPSRRVAETIAALLDSDANELWPGQYPARATDAELSAASAEDKA